VVYLIDNDNYIRRSFELFFKSAKMDYRSFETANEFLGSCSPGDGDIVVLDFNMPGMHGCDVLKEFEKLKIHVPIIIVTATDEPRFMETCRKHGVKAFLRKPVDIEALYDIVLFNLPS
jgi:FixJ family two-component response regulator